MEESKWDGCLSYIRGKKGEGEENLNEMEEEGLRNCNEACYVLYLPCSFPLLLF